MKKLVLYLLLSNVFLLSAEAKLRLPSFFSDHMVLQQKSQVKIWGWSAAAQNLQISFSWSSDTIRIGADGYGKWETKLNTPAAGGPYQITISAASERIVLKDVLIGEVWLCSGQSNMVWSVDHQHEEMREALPSANNSNIRLLLVDRVGAATPQEDLRDSWKVCNAETAKSFGSVAYFIAKKLQKELGVPIGVINASWGGTAAEVWTPEQLVINNEVLRSYANKQPAQNTGPHIPGSLWNSMIYPLSGYKIAGVYWYQGESNVSVWQGYNQLFSTMIQSWRKAWGYELPFYFVQIAPFNYRTGTAQKAALLREQQSRTLALPYTGMVVTTDLVPDTNNIHPPFKKAVSNRLADLALVEVYGRQLTDYKSPVYDRFEISKNKISIYFKHVTGPLEIKGGPLNEIYIAGENGIFYPAKAVLHRNVLIVSSEQVTLPVAVRFGFKDVSIPNLFNTRGLPVSPFRTDNWDLN